uniref:class I SAM-dependent methyltransferase n=1 Tax=Ningiella ruwaisensis TaxID=2364274 RepID=UPI001F503DF8|nr:class I SAM-dependent methyltransferase [Ningiella ruwaisensis]
MLNTASDLKTVILIEDIGSISAHERALALAKKTGFEVYKANPQNAARNFTTAQWQLVFSEKGLALRLTSESQWSDICIDFSSSALQYRKQHGGGKAEAIVKAVGINKQKSSDALLRVLDCTAGMGTDSFVMACAGADVTMLERSVHIASLLEDALFRFEQSADPLSQRLRLIKEDAYHFLSLRALSEDETQDKFDVIYLDPMFPHRKKSALVKKEMQAFQRLLGEDTDSERVLTLALQSANKRVVVKRPNSAAPLACEQKLKPSTEIRSKKHRFDVYVLS